MRSIGFTVEGRPFPKSLWVPQSDAALRGVMAQRVSSWQSLAFPGALDPEWLDRARLKTDEQALELSFAEHGYFDATFVRWEFKRHGAKRRRMHPVSVRGYITQGEVSVIRNVDIAGIEGLPSAIQGDVRAAVSVIPKQAYSSAAYTLSLATVRSTLLARGYAFVDVAGSVDAYPELHAVDVQIVVSAGPASRFGAVTTTGIKGVPATIVADAVSFEEGDPYSPRDLIDTRAALFGLQVFSVVNVTPSLDAPETAAVPVAIDVKNTKWRRIRVGPGIEVETGKATMYGFAEWEHTNLLGRLWHVKQIAKVGVAGVVAQDTEFSSFELSHVTAAPVLDLAGSVTIPHVINKAFSFDVDGRVQVGIETAYRFFSPEVAPGLTWHPLKRRGRDGLTVALGYRIRYFDYFAFTINVDDIVDSPLGLDLTDPYLLSMLDQRLLWDARDDPMAPTRGWYGSLAVAEAGGPLGGNFNFVRTQAELRGYVSAPKIARWNPKLVLAARVGGGGIAPYGEGSKAHVPFAERLYLGGGTTVRGWGANRLGPSVEAENTTTGVTELVPAGGLFDLFGNIELRKAIAGGVSVTTFTDVGRVWPTLADVSLDGLQWSVGGGLRYATVIGPIRADIGVRVGPDAADLPELPRWTLHFGLSEAF